MTKAIIENKKLVFLSEGLSREVIGIRTARQQLAEIEAKDQSTLRPSTIERLQLLRSDIVLWDAQ